MAANESRVEVNVQTVLKGLEKVAELRRQLEALARIKVGGATSASADRAALAAQKLAVQAQELANRQERARLTAERLALSNVRLQSTSQRTANALNKQAEAHVKVFKAMEREEKARARASFAPSTPAGPNVDAHVRDFRRIEAELNKAQVTADGLDKTLGRVGGTLRNLGLGLTSLGSALSIGLTAPLAALGTVSVKSAVEMDSLKRGLVAITGSGAEAEKQLARLTEIAKLPGIGFQEAIQGSIRLQALGVNAEVAERALRAFSNAVALTGGGASRTRPRPGAAHPTHLQGQSPPARPPLHT